MLNLIKQAPGKKGYLQISFAWLFAIIVGAVILFLAIYGVTKLGKTGEQATTAKAGKEIGVLLNPLETGFETAKTTTLNIPVDTQLINECNNFSYFGQQGIKLSQKSFNKWVDTDTSSIFLNKYIFSKNPVQGQTFFIFSKTFNFPYKVSDVVYLTSADDRYCFVNPPKRIMSELSSLNQSNIFQENCPENITRVCFKNTDSNCDIRVNDDMKTVSDEDEIVHYETDALIYGAIFSDKRTYECQTERLIKRAKELASLYDSKQELLVKQKCTRDVDIGGFESFLDSYTDSSELAISSGIATRVDAENSGARCRLW